MVLYKVNKYGLNVLHILDNCHIHFQIGVSFLKDAWLPSINIVVGRLQIIYAYVYINKRKKN